MKNPTTILYDASGNPVTVTLDGSTYRLAGYSKLEAGDAVAGRFKLTDGTNVATVVADGSTNRLSVDAKIASGGANQNVVLYDADGHPLAIHDGTTIGATHPGLTIMGKDTTTARQVVVDSIGRIVIAPSGTVSSIAGFKIGYVTTSALTKVSVNATTYTEMTANGQRSIASSSANDTAAGTGARKVIITYLDVTGAGPYTEEVTLNGTSYVNTVATNICFIESIIVSSVGSGGVNAGTLTLKQNITGGGTTIVTITIGDNRTFMSKHYVPSGLYAYLTGLSACHNGTTVGSGAVFVIEALALNVANAPSIQISDFIRLYGQSSIITRLWGSPIRIPGAARIQVYATPESTSSLIFRTALDFYDQAS